MLMTFYRYLFYRLYRFSEAAPSRWWSEWKASVLLSVMESFTVITMVGVLQILTGRRLVPQDPLNVYTVIGVLVLMGMKHWVFIYQEQWKKDEVDFQQMSARKRRKLNIAFWFVIIGVPTSFVLMLRMLSNANGNL